jgi:hypothetical protein
MSNSLDSDDRRVFVASGGMGNNREEVRFARSRSVPLSRGAMAWWRAIQAACDHWPFMSGNTAPAPLTTSFLFKCDVVVRLGLLPRTLEGMVRARASPAGARLGKYLYWPEAGPDDGATCSTLSKPGAPERCAE